MFQFAQIILGIVLAAGASWRLVSVYLTQKERQRQQSQALANVVRMAMPDAIDQMTPAVGVTTFRGKIEGQNVQVQVIVDTLATRKLPSLWLSLTVMEPVKINGIFDLVMRPNSALSFSNFDLRPNVLRLPTGFPENAVIRSDVEADQLPLSGIANHVHLMADARAKELLISPQGVRFVWLVTEADRARYGVFRQADFGDVLPSPQLILTLAQKAMALRSDLNHRIDVPENAKLKSRST